MQTVKGQYKVVWPKLREAVMQWKEINNQPCSVARAIAIFGDRWTLLILRQIFLRVRRFSDLQKSLGIAKHRLSDRLNRLIDEQVLYKELYDEAHKRYEYKLTEKGLELYPIIVTIAQWGDKWLVDEDGKPMSYVHQSCGQLAEPKVRCSHCGDEITAKNTTVILGPGIQNKLDRDEAIAMDLRFFEK